jgi:hypothetical protein
VVGGAARLSRHDPFEAQLLQIELINEGINDPDGVVIGDPFIQPLREQQALMRGSPSMNRFIGTPSNSRCSDSI